MAIVRNEFPYTNFHELNLDWILTTLNKFESELQNFIALNTVKYANPIQWDITTQYAANTVVVDKNGVAYLSVQPVPSGVTLDNAEYWTQIFNFGVSFGNIKAAIGKDNGDSNTAIYDFYKGECFWFKDELYVALKEIPMGTAIIEKTNAKKVSLNDYIKNIDTSISIIRKSENNITDTAGESYTNNSKNANFQNDGDFSVSAGDINLTAKREMNLNAPVVNIGKMLSYGAAETGTLFDYINIMNEDGIIRRVLLEKAKTDDIIIANNFEELQDAINSNKFVLCFDDIVTDTSLEITNNNARVFMFGVINSTASPIISIKGRAQRIYFKQLIGNNLNNGVEILSTSKGTGRNDYTFDFISNVKVGLYLNSAWESNENGILRTKIHFNYIDYVETGILFEATGRNFINENAFYCGGIEASVVAVKFSGDQSDPFNSNNFYNLSFEGSKKCVDMTNGKNNNFLMFRMYENTGDDIIELKNSFLNLFYAANAVATERTVKDNGINHFRNFQYTQDNEVVGSDFNTAGETFYLTEQWKDENKGINLYNTISYVELNGNTYVLPTPYSFEKASKPLVLVKCITASNSKLLYFNGTVVKGAESLEDNTTYILTNNVLRKITL